MFADRHDAGHRLAKKLLKFREQRPVVLALPRGGVAVGAKVAAVLGAPLDVLVVSKIGVPWQRELSVGAVVGGEPVRVVLSDTMIERLGVARNYLEREIAAQIEESRRRRRQYTGARRPVKVADRVVIVVDDGAATGAKMWAALRAVRQGKPRRLIAAIPVAAADILDLLREEADEVICLHEVDSIGSVGGWYHDFHQIHDDQVAGLLRRS